MSQPPRADAPASPMSPRARAPWEPSPDDGGAALELAAPPGAASAPDRAAPAGFAGPRPVRFRPSAGDYAKLALMIAGVAALLAALTGQWRAGHHFAREVAGSLGLRPAREAARSPAGASGVRPAGRRGAAVEAPAAGAFAVGPEGSAEGQGVVVYAPHGAGLEGATAAPGIYEFRLSGPRRARRERTRDEQAPAAEGAAQP